MKLFSAEKFMFKFGSNFPKLADFRLNLMSMWRRDKSQFGEQELISSFVLKNRKYGFFWRLVLFSQLLGQIRMSSNQAVMA